LKNHWRTSNAQGFRGLSRYLDHKLHAALEAYIYENVDHVVVPSRGLAKELILQFPTTENKVSVLPNAVDLDAFVKPSSFHRSTLLKDVGINSSDVVFLFVALGHFERKGLPLILEALCTEGLESAKLLIVGGTDDLVKDYVRQCKQRGLQDRITFIGMQKDVRPFMWASDAFTLASTYETFSLVAFESAAASLPMITPSLHGIEEIVKDGVTGYVVQRTVEDFAAAMKRFIDLEPRQRAEMGANARSAVSAYGEERFVRRWREYYLYLANLGSKTNQVTAAQRPQPEV
jgi:glycosyltransferase involved in cell wall biosynthesis